MHKPESPLESCPIPKHSQPVLGYNRFTVVGCHEEHGVTEWDPAHPSQRPQHSQEQPMLNVVTENKELGFE